MPRIRAISFPINLSEYASTFYAFTLLLCLAMRDAFLRVLSSALPCIALHCISLHCSELWFDRQLSDPSCRHSLALKPVDIRH